MTLEDLRKTNHEVMCFLRSEEERMTKEFKGRKVRIISDYNGQPFGSSKKALKGKVMTIKYIWFSVHCSIFVEGYQIPLSPSDVELVEEQN